MGDDNDGWPRWPQHCPKCGASVYGIKFHKCDGPPKPEDRYNDGILEGRAQAFREAADKARGEWNDWSNTFSPEYILRHRIAEAIESLSRERGKS